MTPELAKEICDSYGESVYENYSGRGMFGGTTTGVVIRHEHLRAAALLMWEIQLDEAFDQETAEKWYDEMGRRPYRLDNMGRDYIIY